MIHVLLEITELVMVMYWLGIGSGLPGLDSMNMPPASKPMLWCILEFDIVT